MEKDTGVEEAIPADVIQSLSLRTTKVETSQKMECEPLASKKSFLKLFCPVTIKGKKVQKEKKQKVCLFRDLFRQIQYMCILTIVIGKKNLCLDNCNNV